MRRGSRARPANITGCRPIEEWAFAAGSEFKDDGVPVDDADDPSKRWIAATSAKSRNATRRHDAACRSAGSASTRTACLDIAGNVWEWTATCFVRQKIGAARRRGRHGRSTNCGVRVVEGRHRAYVTDFIRDARAGGCAVGVPPAISASAWSRTESSAWCMARRGSRAQLKGLTVAGLAAIAFERIRISRTTTRRRPVSTRTWRLPSRSASG